MTKATIQATADEHIYMVSGSLDFESIIPLLNQIDMLINKAINNITFNFSQITQSNSAGLAFLTALLRKAKAKHKTIQFLHLPTSLLAAAKISDLDKIIPCAL